jgi:hypothetical protein
MRAASHRKHFREWRVAPNRDPSAAKIEVAQNEAREHNGINRLVLYYLTFRQLLAERAGALCVALAMIRWSVGKPRWADACHASAAGAMRPIANRSPLTCAGRFWQNNFWRKQQ